MSERRDYDWLKLRLISIGYPKEYCSDILNEFIKECCSEKEKEKIMSSKKNCNSLTLEEHKNIYDRLFEYITRN